MAYTVGATHVLTGSGTVAVSSPVGLSIALTSLPVGLTEIFGTPNALFDAGHISMGNADGYLPMRVLSRVSELVYPLPDSLTLLGYDLLAGATATVKELVPVVPAVSLQPYERTPILVAVASSAGTAAPNTTATVTLYTVPAASMLLVGHAEVRTLRTVVATTAARANSRMLINGILWLMADLYTNGVGDQVADELAAPLLLPAGTVVTVTHRDDGTAGITIRSWMLHGTVFSI